MEKLVTLRSSRVCIYVTVSYFLPNVYVNGVQNVLARSVQTRVFWRSATEGF